VRRLIAVSIRLLFGLGVTWAAVCLAADTRDSLFSYRHRGGNTLPCLWRFGMAPVERLRRCAEEVRARVPAGSVVAFGSPAAECDSDFYRWRWAAYLLPDEDVVRLGDPTARQVARYVVTFRLPLDEPRLKLLDQLYGCRLYGTGS
jgi:hypothetical protein